MALNILIPIKLLTVLLISSCSVIESDKINTTKSTLERLIELNKNYSPCFISEHKQTWTRKTILGNSSDPSDNPAETFFQNIDNEEYYFLFYIY